MKSKISGLVLLSLLATTPCGRKGRLSHMPDEKRPKFNQVVDENPNLKFPENINSNQQDSLPLTQDAQPSPLGNHTNRQPDSTKTSPTTP